MPAPKPTRRTLLAGTAAALAAPAMTRAADPPPADRPPGRVLLLGDSVLDNGVYVPGKPAVIEQVRAELPAGWAAELVAVDGDVVADVAGRLAAADLPDPPAGGDYFVVSAGGNDALRSSSVLTRTVPNAAAVFAELADLREEFTARYKTMLDAVVPAGARAAVCTIYDPNYPDPRLQRLATAALPAFNDVILRSASARGLPVIDLRVLFDAPADYANPIEPSAVGGAKIAGLVRRIVTAHDFAGGGARLYGGG